MASKFFALARSSILVPSLRGLTAINLSPIKVPRNNFAAKPKEKEDKRPASPFALYVRDNFQSAKEGNAALKTPQILAALADEWHSAPENEKNEYRTRADELKAEYKLKHEKKDYWKALQPRRPPSPFALFVRDNFKSAKEENFSLKTPQLLAALANEWHSAPDNEKDEYRARSDELKAEYKVKLENYNSTLPPPLPKRPASSSYTLYIKENFGKFYEQRPNLTFAEIQKEMGKEWRALSEEDREVYRAKLDDMNEEYKQHVVEYERNLTDEGRKFVELKYKEGLKKLRKQKREFLNYPKKPAGAFFIFLEKEKENFTRGPDESHIEWVKHMGLKWKSMNEEEKVVYRDIQVKLQEEYKSEVAEWRSKFEPDELGGSGKE